MTPAERFEVIAFDADDTLWRNEDHFRDSATVFQELVGPYVGDDTDPIEVLHRIERTNVPRTGYGVTAYTLSMVEAAIEVTDGHIPASVLGAIVARGYEHLQHPVELLPGVVEALDDLATSHPLLLITKGDLLHQTSKIELSGIADRFHDTLVVTEKDAATYAAAFDRWKIDPASVVMVGNSLRSDVLPIMELGGHGVHIPYRFTWAHEQVDDHGGEHTDLESIDRFVDWFRGTG